MCRLVKLQLAQRLALAVVEKLSSQPWRWYTTSARVGEPVVVVVVVVLCVVTRVLARLVAVAVVVAVVVSIVASAQR